MQMSSTDQEFHLTGKSNLNTHHKDTEDLFL